MHEVLLASDGERECAERDWTPIALATSTPPASQFTYKPPPPPILSLSLLISLPSEGEDEDDLLPDLVVGSTLLAPMISLPGSDDTDADADSDKMEAKGEIEMIEDQTEWRRARWIKEGGQWRTEGV
ncbi:hypothetical protein P7C73_g3377, partial [Tremellales sp. Uapishka_1]